MRVVEMSPLPKALPAMKERVAAKSGRRTVTTPSPPHAPTPFITLMERIC